MPTNTQIRTHKKSPPPLRGRVREGGQLHAPAYKDYLIEYAKDLRTNQTDAESKLWYFLRAKRFCDLKFRRQQPVGGYIVDFVCQEKKVVIELDGSQHLNSKLDKTRDAFLKSAGYDVLRFWNNDVLQQTESVLESIYHHIFTSSPQPSPSGGEGVSVEHASSVDVRNFGCRLNVYEGEVIKQQAANGGLEDAIIFNSCAVTKEAERQVKQAIRKAAREHPGKKLIVTGCSAQIDAQQYLDMKEVSAVLGNEDKLHAQNYATINTPASNLTHPARGGGKGGALATNTVLQKPPLPIATQSPSPPQAGGIKEVRSVDFVGDNQRAIVNDIMSIKETAGHLISSIEGHSRAFVQVQNGCDHRCTFCIIPYGRGNSRSVPAGEVVTQIRTLAEQGYKEVVLTGVDVSDYGNGLPGDLTLGELCKKILKLVPDLPRLRISSIDAVEVDNTLLDLLANEPRLMPHMHLSLQAGNNMVLKRMKRRHLRQDILDFCHKVRELRPDIVYGADIIAGFPTETDEMFEDTYNIIEEVGLTYLHVFPYSSRPGTPAQKMPQVPKAIRKERAAQLRAQGKLQEEKLYRATIGTRQQVLMEQNGVGHTPQFVAVKAGDYQPGELIELEITAEMVM